MYDLTRFALSDMTECGAALRQLGRDAESMEEVANRIVRHLYDQFLDPQTGEQSCVLVRLFKTHPFGELDAELQRFARDLLGRPPESPAMKCLTLLATVGARPEWNSRRSSAGHQAIPLTSELVVPQFPMIVQLIHQFGLEFNTVLRPDPAPLLDLKQRAYDVFHVPQALGSPSIPAQDEFVIPFGVRSVLGFGGMLPTGDFFAVILFSRAPIARDTADLFQALAPSVKIAILPFAQVVFAGGEPATGGGDVLGRNNQADEPALRLGARAAALEQSLEMHEQIVRAQAGELERALAEFRNVL
jgi:hypothetical protein